MTPAEYRTTIAQLGLNQSQAARLLGVAVRNSQRWVAGDRRISTPAARLLKLIAILKLEPQQVVNLLGLREDILER